jgi:uncharacterized protein (DUF1778 family)
VAAKSQQLQIRIAPAQKATLRRLAKAAGLDVSSFVLARLLPAEQGRFTALVRRLADEADRRFALAELHDLLRACAAPQFGEAVAVADLRDLPAWLQNYVAAMVEQAAAQKGLAPPAWVGDVQPSEEPHFTTPLRSLRLHLLASAPTAFKRRNIFIDAGIGARV